MNNITIGIVARDEVLNNVNLQVVTKNNLKYIHNKCNYIAILNYDNSPIDTEVLKLCDGIIIQGGSDIYHYNKDKKHIINIKEDTIMYKLFGPTLEVNTRHLYAINKVKKPFIVSAVSQDNIIESIEYIDDNHFLLGVQFHPEDLDNTEALYNYFLKEVYKRKH